MGLALALGCGDSSTDGHGAGAAGGVGGAGGATTEVGAGGEGGVLVSGGAGSGAVGGQGGALVGGGGAGGAAGGAGGDGGSMGGSSPGGGGGVGGGGGASNVGGSAGNGGDGGAGGSAPVICGDVLDCPPSTECSIAACVNGSCTTEPVAAGDLATQTPNDCKTLRCDGLGNLAVVADPLDLPADDGDVCTSEACVGTTPSHPSNGLCTPCTDWGKVRCDGTCIDPSTSDLHCGATAICQGPDAGVVCGAGAVCTDGACATTCLQGCPSDTVCNGAGACVPCDVCGGSCVDVQTDENNCGGCGTICDPGLQCVHGTCAGDLYVVSTWVAPGPLNLYRIDPNSGAILDTKPIVSNLYSTMGYLQGAATYVGLFDQIFFAPRGGPAGYVNLDTGSASVFLQPQYDLVTFDRGSGSLFATSGSDLRIIDPKTRATLSTKTSTSQILGLAADGVHHRIYAIRPGDHLWVYDIAADSWSQGIQTQVTWGNDLANYSLSYDERRDVLYFSRKISFGPTSQQLGEVDLVTGGVRIISYGIAGPVAYVERTPPTTCTPQGNPFCFNIPLYCDAFQDCTGDGPTAHCTPQACP
ncbi:MAG: hypothetical protein U0271_06760 [Polyangiaceae bacterium]